MSRALTRWSRCAPVFVLAAFISINAFAGNTDIDADGIFDSSDNCVLISNATQIDADSDGWGNACDADFNNDGVTNFGDYAQLAAAFLTNAPDLDLTGDGIINFADFVRVKEMFFTAPGPAGYAYWILPADGMWNVADNWFPKAVPPAEAVVFIDQPGDIVVTYANTAGNNTVAGIVFHDTLIFGASYSDRLVVAGDVTANAPLFLTDGVLDVSGNLNINESIHFSDGELHNANLTAVNQPIKIEGEFFTVIFDAVTLSSDLEITNRHHLFVKNGLTLNNANILISADNWPTNLIFSGTQTLGGTGNIIFSGTTAFFHAGLRGPGNDQVLTISSGITVRTGTTGGTVGILGNYFTTANLDFRGQVISDLPGRSIKLRGSLLNVQGPLTASNGGSIEIGGEWTNAAGNPINVTDGNLFLFGEWTNNGTISGNNSTVEFCYFPQCIWTNNGAISMTDTEVLLGGNVTTAGIGTITSNNPLILEGVLDNTGAVLDFNSADGPEITLGEGSGVLNGTIVGTNPLSVMVSSSSSTPFFDGVTLATDVTIGNGARLELRNNIVLDNVNVTMTASDLFSQIGTKGDVNISGNGEFLFGGTTLGNTLNRIWPVTDSSVLTIENGVNVRADSANGHIGSVGPFGTSIVIMNGALINLRAGGDIDVRGLSFELGGSITVGDDARVEISSNQIAFTPESAIDIDISSTGNGLVAVASPGTLALNGTANFALQGGYLPVECEAFTFLTYLSFTGGFDSVSGPDLGAGETFTVDELQTFAQAVAPGAGC